MPEEENIEKENQKSKEVNENISQKQAIQQPLITNTKSEIEKPEIENMEVHHHPDLHHRKKHWKEYFLEFLMIFLAVTLGFFAENIRDHLGDNEKEHKYMISLLQDLKADTADLHVRIPFLQKISNSIDTVEDILEEPNVEKDSISLFRNAFWIPWYLPTQYSNRTIEGLKSSGNLRLIKHEDVTTSLMQYDNFVRTIVEWEFNEHMELYNHHLGDEYNRIFKLQLYKSRFLSILNNYSSITFSGDENIDTIKVSKSTLLLTNDKSIIQVFINELQTYSIDGQGFIKDLIIRLQMATKLIQLIQKEYHLQ